MPAPEFPAISISEDWDRTCRIYRVTSVFDRAVNLEDGRGRRCTLITEQEDFLPRSALVNVLPRITPNEMIDIAAEDVPYAYDPFLPAGLISGEWRALIREWRMFLRDGELKVLEDAWDDFDWRTLVGLGPGLTPAGDDFLHGRLTAHIRSSSGEDSVVRDFRNNYKPGSTTALSESFYEDLLTRMIWRRGKNLLEALETDDGRKVLYATKALTDWGHTSGRAWLAGFAFGAEEI